ncbi:MAG: tetratricopeptide repeat protein [Pyrinomonadaceae bacterium]
MFLPRKLFLSTLPKTLFLCMCLFGAGTCSGARAQSETAKEVIKDTGDLKHGIELYRQGDANAAVPVLRAAVQLRKDDARAWHFLGLALSRTRAFKESAEAFARAIKLQPTHAHAQAGLAYAQFMIGKYDDAERAASIALSLDARNVEAHYVVGSVRLRKLDARRALEAAEAALKFNAKFTPAQLLKAQALVAIHIADYASTFHVITNGKPRLKLSSPEEHARLTRQLKEAADALEQYIKLNPNPSSLPELQEQLETLRAHAQRLTPEGEPFVYTAEEVTTKAVILTKPTPVYPRRPGQTWSLGWVVLRLVLASDGQVRHILIVSGLPDGITEAVVKAAREIKFTPATKDGHPVSQFVTLQYLFNQ